MFTARIFCEQPIELIVKSLSSLSGSSKLSLVEWVRRPSFLIVRHGKSIWTTTCTALASPVSAQERHTTVRLVFIPSLFAVLSLLLWFVAIVYSWLDYRASMEANRLDPAYQVHTPPWGLYLTGILLAALIIGGSMRRERDFIVAELKRLLAGEEE